MGALSGEQFGAYARAQIAAAEQILARHYLVRGGDCSCGRPRPCSVAQSCSQTRDHYRARLALLEQTAALPRMSAVRAASAPRWRRRVVALFGGGH
jgi:hypothetical protein